MSVFLDTSKRRKIYFRSGVVAVFGLAFFALTIFMYNLVFGHSPETPAVKYADTVDSYHYYYSPANKNKIALTFDDGPKPTITREIAKILKDNDAPGMFFFIGQQIILNPNIVDDISKQGFDIGNHSFTHQEDIHSTQNRLALELRATNYLISKITGKTPVYYRPPFLLGIGIDPTVNPYIPVPKDVLWSLEDGLVPTGTDIDTRDWMAHTPDEIVKQLEKVLLETPNGHIVLLHEEETTLEALPKIISMLKEKGYELVSLPSLLTPPQTVALTPNLKIGSTDENSNGEVSKLQWFLYEQGDLDPYLLTGKFDASTRSALTNFQIRNQLINPSNIDPSKAGVVTAETADAIKSISTVTPSPTNKAGVLEKVSNGIAYLIRGAYVNFVPVFRVALIFMVKGALVLVLARCLFIAVVLLIRDRRKRVLAGLSVPKEYKKYPGVSVLIPAYNEEENIRGTIESVIRSTYPRKEIIVIDDGSKDKTGEVVKETMKHYPHEPIRLLQVENGGKSSALNHGISVSKFDICVVIDADAVLDKNALYYFTRHFGNPEVGAVAGKVRTTGNKGFLDAFQMLEYAIGQNIDKRTLSTLGAVGVVPGPAGAWRKEDVIKVGGFSNETLVEDQDMTLAILRSGKKIVYEERAISYTETPENVKNFLKQRFRWIYGTMQCFYKNVTVFKEQPTSVLSLVIMPNIFVFNILLPLTFPFADLAFILGLMFGEWQSMLIPFFLFTAFDLLYAWIGCIGEKDIFRMLITVPIQRVSYRQLIYYTVIKSVVRAIEGTSTGWNKFTKTGSTQRFYFENVATNKAETKLPPAPNWFPDIVKPQSIESASPSIQDTLALSVSLPIKDETIVN